MALKRSAYHKRGANYTDKATLVRWDLMRVSGWDGVHFLMEVFFLPLYYVHKSLCLMTSSCTSRCVRPDQSSATVRCHYLTDGTVNFAFTMRRAEYFIPVGILLKSLMETSDRELYDKIMASAAPGSGHAAFVSERAELLLQHSARLGLKTRQGERISIIRVLEIRGGTCDKH